MNIPHKNSDATPRRRSNRIVRAVAPIALACLLLSLLSRTRTSGNPSLNHHRQLSHVSEYYPSSRVTHLARAFPSIPSRRPLSWCIPKQSYDSEHPTGFIYVKVHKTASTTLASVALRIAENHAIDKSTPCSVRWEHLMGRNYSQRQHGKSFLLGSVRDPTKRNLSHVFFTFVTGQGKTPTDELIIDKLKFYTSGGTGGFQHNFLTQRTSTERTIWEGESDFQIKNLNIVEDYVSEIIQQYDFLVVADRIDESLVALQLIMGLYPEDILYISSRVSGGYSIGRDNRCKIIEKVFISPKVQDFIDSGEWYVRNVVDILLFKVANKSLDFTIEKIGTKKFQRELIRHKQMIAIVEEHCGALTESPCTHAGMIAPRTDRLGIEKSVQNCIVDLFNSGKMDEMIAM